MTIAILAVAAGVRLRRLDRHGYQLDELWAAEVAVGNGSVHQHPPTNQVMEPPRLFDLRGAPPVWRVWSHIDVTHPPLYSLLLRLWEELFGDTDVSGRALSVVLSVAAVGVLMDTVRRAMGWTVAGWAGVLAAVSGPLVDYGRETRNYSLMILAATIVANLIVRLGISGHTTRRLIALALAVFATLMSHYFSVGFVAAVGLYAAVALRGGARTRILSAMSAGVALFGVLWGPFMWRQRHLFSTTDSSTLFLHDDVPNHIGATLQRMLTTPIRLLFEPHAPGIWIAAGGAFFFVLPWLLVRRRPWIGLFAAWMAGAVFIPALFDFTRGTAHLFFIRYSLLAAPAVCVLWPAVLSALGGRWAWCVAPVAVACVAGLPDVYGTWQADPAEVARFVTPVWKPDDLLIFAADPGHLSSAGAQYMMVDRYLRPIPCRVLFLTAPPTGDAAAAVAKARRIWFFTDNTSWKPFLPNLSSSTKIPTRVFPGRGIVFELKSG